MARAGHGLILGKFLPPHAGHEFLVRFASGFVDRLTVLVCSIQQEPIPGALRYRWMKELFPEVRLVHVTEELPQEPGEHPRFWDMWRETVKGAAQGTIDYVFASEGYGDRLAREVGARFIPVDPGRRQVPVSGTLVRARPLDHWEHIPPCVRPYFVKRVCLFGPESTGKSTLAIRLARHFRTVYVAEFARELLNPRQGVCTPEDIPLIACGQVAAEDALARQACRVLFCDTDPLLTTVWSEILFGYCPAAVRELAAARRYDLHLLLDVDVPWVDDGQRALVSRRREFFDRCQALLASGGRRYCVVRGDWEERFQRACQEVQKLLEDSQAPL